MRPLTLEQQLERSVHQARAKRLGEQKQMSHQSTALARTVDQPTELTSWHAMRVQATELVQSGFLPRAVNTPEKAMAIIQTGKELGLGPMQSLRSIHIIEGKPTMSADLIAGLALAKLPGSVLRVVETSDKKCVVDGGRAGQELTRFTYTIEDAQRAGLAGKDNWKRHPRAMLRARAITEAARAIFPDTCVGLYDADELGAVTGPTGEIVELPRVEVTQVNPHMAPDEQPGASEDEDVARTLVGALERIKADIAICDSYDKALALRGLLGTRAKQSELTRVIQKAGEEGSINSATKQQLGKLWMHCDRQVAKLEKQLATGPEDAVVGDDADGTDAFGPTMREPGEEG